MYNFQGKAIKCNSENELLHLAQLAKNDGWKPYAFSTNVIEFPYFKTWIIDGDAQYTNDNDAGKRTKISYSDFIANPETE